MGALKTLLGKARPQIPLEALASGRRIGLYKTDYRKSLKRGESYLLCELENNADENTQEFIGALSLGEEIEINRDGETGKYTARCGSIEFGSLSGAAAHLYDGEEFKDCGAFIKKIELGKDGAYVVTIAIRTEHKLESGAVL